jgi:hypothetical protein
MSLATAVGYENDSDCLLLKNDSKSKSDQKSQITWPPIFRGHVTSPHFRLSGSDFGWNTPQRYGSPNINSRNVVDRAGTVSIVWARLPSKTWAGLKTVTLFRHFDQEISWLGSKFAPWDVPLVGTFKAIFLVPYFLSAPTSKHCGFELRDSLRKKRTIKIVQTLQRNRFPGSTSVHSQYESSFFGTVLGVCTQHCFWELLCVALFKGGGLYWGTIVFFETKKMHGSGNDVCMIPRVF